jgi:hypothetical protein
MFIQNKFRDTEMLQALILAVVYRYKAAILLQFEHTAIRTLSEIHFKPHAGLFHPMRL